MKNNIIGGVALLLACWQAQAVADENYEDQLIARYQAGEYWKVGSDGAEYLLQQPGNDQLRLDVANSLAWTGRLRQAIEQYQLITSPALALNSTIGLANVYRWQGRPDLALPLYRRALRLDPTNSDAIDGLTRAERELRPSTRFSFVSGKDSSAVVQNGGTLSHRFRGDDLALSYEITLGGFHQSQNSATANSRDLSIAIEHDGMMFSPRLEVSLQQSPSANAFAQVTLKFDQGFIDHASVGWVNWGKTAFTPQALNTGLGAFHLGFDGGVYTWPGRLAAAYNLYQISDSNLVQDMNLRFYPSWPFSGDIRYFAGVSGRFARYNDPRYWSPSRGFVSADLGIMGEWTTLDWDLSLYGQRGFPAGGEAQKSYALGGKAKRHIGRDWAASVSVDLLKNARVGAYRSRFLSMDIEKLW